jgi:hypothetical protein
MATEITEYFLLRLQELNKIVSEAREKYYGTKVVSEIYRQVMDMSNAQAQMKEIALFCLKFDITSPELDNYLINYNIDQFWVTKDEKFSG